MSREAPASGSRPSSRPSSVGGGRNVVKENRDAAAALRPPSKVNAPDKVVAKNAANVPHYLKRVKMAVADEQLVIEEHLGLNRVDDGAPPGHRWLTDSERMEIIEGLQDKKKELESQHSKLPFKAETEGQRRRADALEKQLRELEGHLSQFAKPRVLVKDD